VVVVLEFIKMFGIGVLYTLLSPFILAFFLIFVVYSIVNYLVFEVINLGGFFLGKRFTTETELEKKLAKMKQEKVALSSQPKIENEEVVNNEEGDLHD
jgi:hypothetical protein